MAFAWCTACWKCRGGRCNDVITADADSALQLEVKQANLADVLKKIAKTTGIAIHYSVLPEGRVTATCVGPGAKQVLECLLNHKADLIFRYSKASRHPSSEAIAEAWVLGAKYDATKSVVVSTDCATGQESQLQDELSSKPDNSEAEQAENLLKMAQSKDASERAQGIGGLLAAGEAGDPAIRATLEAALTDSNAEVRAQAISSFAQRNEEGTEAALQNALLDESVDVRVMAVDSAGENTALLQQALNDKDETVRSLAALKLESLKADTSQ